MWFTVNVLSSYEKKNVIITHRVKCIKSKKVIYQIRSWMVIVAVQPDFYFLAF